MSAKMCLRVLSMTLLIALPMTHATAGLFDTVCLIKSPVRGLSVDDISSHGFSVEWDFNVPPEIPIDIRVSINGRDATPDVPWWMMVFDKGAGMSYWGHGVEPGQAYQVTVEQKSVCGKWSSTTIAVSTSPTEEGLPIDDAIASATQHVNTEISEAPDNIADINDEYYWTEALICDDDDYSCAGSFVDPHANVRDDDLAIWDPRYDGAQIDSILDDGQRTYIRTNDLSAVSIYEEDDDGGLTVVPIQYDPVSGVTSFDGDPRDYKIYVGDYLVEIGTDSADYGSAPDANVCDPLAGPCV